MLPQPRDYYVVVHYKQIRSLTHSVTRSCCNERVSPDQQFKTSKSLPTSLSRLYLYIQDAIEIMNTNSGPLFLLLCVCVCVSVRERERECVCVCVRAQKIVLCGMSGRRFTKFHEAPHLTTIYKVSMVLWRPCKYCHSRRYHLSPAIQLVTFRYEQFSASFQTRCSDWRFFIPVNTLTLQFLNLHPKFIRTALHFLRISYRIIGGICR